LRKGGTILPEEARGSHAMQHRVVVPDHRRKNEKFSGQQSGMVVPGGMARPCEIFGLAWVSVLAFFVEFLGCVLIGDCV